MDQEDLEHALLELVMLEDAVLTARTLAQRGRPWEAATILLGGLDHGHQSYRLMKGRGAPGGTVELP